MKKKYTVIEYVSVAREYYDIEAESEEEAIQQVIDDADREPDQENILKPNGWEAEEELPPEEK